MAQRPEASPTLSSLGDILHLRSGARTLPVVTGPGLSLADGLIIAAVIG